MKIEAASVADYWANLPQDWRRDWLTALQSEINHIAPDIEEGLGYGMLRYAWDADRILCHLNCQARHVGLYLGDVAALDPEGRLTKTLNIGKSCVRIRKSDDMAPIRALLQAKRDLRLAESLK